LREGSGLSLDLIFSCLDHFGTSLEFYWSERKDCSVVFKRDYSETELRKHS